MPVLAVLAAAAFAAGSSHPIRTADSAPFFGGHGSWISFSRGVVDLSGRTLRNPPETSNTGRYVVHELHRPPYTLTITWADGTHSHVLTGAESPPAWDADDSLLVFAHAGGLALADGDGSNVRQIPVAVQGELGDPVLSPDGAWVADVETQVPTQGGPYKNVPGGVTVVPVTGGRLRPVGDEETCAPDAELQWSSDSEWLAYLAGDCEYSLDILRVVHVSDGAATPLRVRLATGGYGWAAGSDLLAYPLKHGVGIAAPDREVRLLPGAGSPTWAPTGTRLAVGRAGHVEVLDAAGGSARTIANGSSPSWSPTGEWIAYGVHTCGPRQGIHLVHPDGTGDHRLTNLCSIDANGARVITGTRFSDEIVANDGLRQSISCGASRDTVYADGKDVVAHDCERVVRTH